MVLVAVVLAVALIGMTLHAQSSLRLFTAAAELWAQERRELLNRIQRPDVVPLTPQPMFVTPDAEHDDMEMVGTIAYLDDDVAGTE